MLAGRERLRGKLSYSNIGFALAPDGFTLAELRDVYEAALGYEVSATNLKRVLLRRGAIEPVGKTKARHGPAGGRPAEVYRFCARRFEVTDPFAVLRPPSDRGLLGVDLDSESADNATMRHMRMWLLLIGVFSIAAQAAAAAAVFWQRPPRRAS